MQRNLFYQILSDIMIDFLQLDSIPPDKLKNTTLMKAKENQFVLMYFGFTSEV